MNKQYYEIYAFNFLFFHIKDDTHSVHTQSDVCPDITMVLDKSAGF